MTNEIIEANETPPSEAAQRKEPSPLQLIDKALSQGLDINQLSALVELQRTMNADQAKRDFVAAMSAFKQNPPRIIKDVLVSFTSKGGKTEYRHADLAKISRDVDAALERHGLMKSWETVSADGGMVGVKCIITHINGHSESAYMQSVPDQSGGKNPIQAQGSAVSYLQRYTLLSVLGLVAEGVDNDGRGYVEADAVEMVTKEQITTIEDTIEANGIEREKVLEWLKIDTFKDLRADLYQKVIDKLNERAKAS